MLKDTLVVIDPGHGGIDSGAIGNNLVEKDLNLKVSKYIYNRLKELNIPTVITREEDEYLPKEKRIERIQTLINNTPNVLLISNHMNAGNGEGVEIVYSLKNTDTFPNIVIDNIEKQGQKKRKVYQRRLPENPNLDYYYILRESNVDEPILIEYGFIDNKEDSIKLKKDLLKYGEAVVEGIANYLGVPMNNVNQYIVEKNDTLYSIGKRFNISVEELKKINNLTSNMIQVGQVLNLKEEKEYEIYTVQKGDSLYSIARRYNIKLPELIEINNLNDNLVIYVNQKLLIPKQNNLYIVQKGDTLWSIAKKNNMTVEELKEKNNLTNNLLVIGQEIIL